MNRQSQATATLHADAYIAVVLTLAQYTELRDLLEIMRSDKFARHALTVLDAAEVQMRALVRQEGN